MAKQSEKVSNIHIEFKHLMIIIIAAMLSYVAYYLKYPNTWTGLLDLCLLILLILDINDIKGVKVLVYGMVISIIALPITIFSLKVPLLYQLIIFVINIVLLGFIAVGLKSLKKWGYVLALIVFVLSIASLVMAIWPAFSSATWSFNFIVLVLKQLFTVVFYAIGIVYLLKHRNYFE